MKFLEETNPLVSIVIPCYNHALFVQKTIQSVIDQDYENIELIIIDDGSKDNSVDVIKEMIPICEERFVRFEFRHRPNTGLAVTLNECLKWANGKFFSPVASDDILLSHKISTLLSAWNNDKSLGVIFGDAEFVGKNSEKIELDIYSPFPSFNIKTNSFLLYYTAFNFDYKDKEKFGSYESILSGNYLPAMSCIILKSLLVDEGGWNPECVIEDWQMWLELSKKTQFFLVDRMVSEYRLHGNNSADYMREKLILNTYSLLQKQEKYALSNNFKQLYYKKLAGCINGLRSVSFSLFVKELIFNLKSLTFLKYYFLMTAAKFLENLLNGK
ncbi:glycosyltransferase [Acinetobacter chinensis]|uniref:glycosyltransferase n=1 Tax=Acinetobacter chinensis TaxID=2004650 RepID=UPI002934BE80|nr:glycosyltransferase [Acinetobacter chinensis]WOE41343.1 glycosyltransferase [Acinetobacter chinensis]